MEQLQTVQDIFDKALELPEAQREAYIKRRCGSNDELQAKVRQLLTADQTSAGFFDALSGQLYPFINNPVPIQKSVDHYQLQQRIGAGGMGVVYKAVDTRLQREIAIKFMAVGHAGIDLYRTRFLHEAKAAAQLQHPNLCEVYDVGETDDGQLYIVTPFCPGQSLTELIRSGQLSIGNILTIFMQLCDALHVTHQKGIVHRDLKPSNIIVDQSLSIKLVDFGIAKITGVDVSQTREIVGSIAYISPEQFSHDASDHRSDIWSVGVVLYEALSGQKPYPGNSASAVMYQLFHQDLPQLDCDDIPLLQDFNRILGRCLQLDPQYRYQDALTLFNDLSTLEVQLQELHRLAYLPKRVINQDMQLHTNSSILLEIRSVTMLGIEFAAGTEPTDINKAKIILLKHGSISVGKKENRQLYFSFGYPKLREGAADTALRCAIETMQSQASMKIVLDNIKVLIDATETDQSPTIPLTPVNALQSLFVKCDNGNVLLTSAVYKSLRQRYPLLEHHLPDQIGYRWHKDMQAVADYRYTSPFISRFYELGLLKHHWQAVTEGESRAVMVSGEAGIGKSRIVHELKQTRMATPGSQLLEFNCYPNQSESAFSPVIEGIKQGLSKRFYRQQDSDLETSDDSLASQLSQWLTTLKLDKQTLLPFLIRMFRVDTDAYETIWRQHSPEALKRHGLNALQTCLTAQAQQGAILWIIEDLHWADTSTLEWIEQLLTAKLPENMMLLFTGRNEIFHRWRTHSEVSHLALNKLNNSETRQLLRYYHPGQTLNPQLEDSLIEKTGGIPLYIEEYAQIDLTQDAQQNSNKSDMQPPDSLQELILTRLDRLGNAKKTAQIASVIGRKFQQEILHSMLEISTQALDNQLNQLLEANVIYRCTNSAGQFIFKHALIQDALYLSLPEPQQQQLHLQLAQQMHPQLQQPNAQSVTIKTEWVAQHYSAAHHHQDAIPLWLQSARQALQSSATEEAAMLSRRGLLDLQQLQQDRQSDELEIALIMTLGPALMATRGYSDQGVADIYQRALDLSENTQNPELLLPVIFGLWTYYIVRAKFAEGIHLTRRMVQIAETEDNDEYRVEAYLGHGLNTYYLGYLAEAQASFHRVLTCYQPEMSAAHTQRYGQDPLTVALSYLSWMVQEQGDTQQAQHYSQQALAHAKACQHPFTLCYAQVYAAAVQLLTGDLARAEQLLTDNLQLCKAQSVSELYKLTSVFMGLLKIMQGEGEQGLQQFREAMAIFKTTGAEMFFPLWMTFEAQTLAQLGRPKEARAVLERAKQQTETYSAWVYLPRIEQGLKSLENHS